MTTPAAADGLALLRDLASAARDEGYRYWERNGGDEPEVLVLAGPRLWQLIRTTAARQGGPFPWWHLDGVKDEVIGMDGRTRIIRAGIGPDEWRVALLTERHGSI